MSCPNCGTPVISSYEYCPKCGVSLLATELARGASDPLARPHRGVHGWNASTPARIDSDLAFVLEVLPGFFGFLGIGHMYSGHIVRGVTLLVCFWFFVAVEMTLLSVIVGICLVPAHLIIPVLSAFWVRSEVDRRRLDSGSLPY